MNSNLANQLLASIMNWDPQTLASERAALEFMGSMKYDGYDRYMPGMRFMSSLVQWLDQFKDEKDKEIAFDFIKKRLVFISSTQMNYLVDLLYDSKIRPDLLKKATAVLDEPSYKLSSSKVRKQFKIEKRSSLVVGLSDGAHTDILRRSAGFSNEQVLTNYYPDSKKLQEMLEELGEDDKLKGVENPFFRSIYLIDDFTASGKSFIRFNEEDGKYHGKLKKIISELCADNIDAQDGKPEERHLSYLLDPSEKCIHIDILFCVATEKAKTKIEHELDAFLAASDFKKEVKCKIHVVQVLEDKISQDIKNKVDLISVLEKNEYLDLDAVMSKSYAVGKHDNAYLGFDECALPVVLFHNTPNNSLPILWQDSKKFRGLFPRISRH